MNEPSKPIHWVTRKLLGSRASHFKTVTDYSAAELARFQTEYQCRVQRYEANKVRRAATKVLAILVGSLGFVVLILFMFTPLFVPLVPSGELGVFLIGAILLALLTPFAGLFLYWRFQPGCLCPSCGLGVGALLGSFCPVCGKRSLKEPAVNDYNQYNQCLAAHCPDCGSSLHIANQEGKRSFRNCHCTHCGIPLATADGPDFAGPKMSKMNASLLNVLFAVFWGLLLWSQLSTRLPNPYPMFLGLVGGAVAYAYMKQRSAKSTPPA